MGVYRSGVRWVCVSVVFLFLLAIPAFSQLPTATILGDAKDASGGVLPGVTVTVVNVETGLTRVVKTGDDGSYRVLELPVGAYEVKAEHAGFKSIDRKGIVLEVTQQAVINLDFQVGAAEQQVVVNEEVPMINTQNATLGGTVNETKMTELPLNGRNYIDLALLQPGVDKDKNQGNQAGTTFSVNGAPPADHAGPKPRCRRVWRRVGFGWHPGVSNRCRHFPGGVWTGHGQPDGGREQRWNQPVARRRV